jgi:hypothetical protein
MILPLIGLKIPDSIEFVFMVLELLAEVLSFF